ncbi:MAG: hypothetical protein P1V81_00025 [Planctomycetota bacterium]|nr:hypothetical protein [Planctomycetota bacterium]
MRARTTSLLIPALALGLLFLALAQDREAQAFEDPVSATRAGLIEQLELGASGNLRLEAFRMVPRGRRWLAEREDVGMARLVFGRVDGVPQLELDQTWIEDGTRLRRVLRGLDVPGVWSFVYREWRATGEGRIGGRGLVLDAAADGQLSMREWAGGPIRSVELLAEGRRGRASTVLAWLEGSRKRRGPLARSELLFDSVEGVLDQALVLETPLGLGFLSGVRLLDVLRVEDDGEGRLRTSTRPARYLLMGSELLGFVEGDFEAVRDLAPALLASR